MPDTQKVIVVTGTSSGFGLLASARLACRGHFVYATMRNAAKQKDLLDEVAKRGVQVSVRELDVVKPVTIAKVVQEIIGRHGHIDVVVNNAGFGLGGFFEDLTSEEIREQMEVNFFGQQNVCREVVPHMRRRKRGLIINISSIAGQTGTPALGAYNASKWALEGFSESLYHEMAPFGVKVSLVEPGSYPTKIFSDASSSRRRGKNSDNPQSPYYEFTKRIEIFVERFVAKSTKNPENVAALIERIVDTPNPKLRYVSDFEAWARLMGNRIVPPPLYGYIYRRFIYGNRKYPV